MQLFEVGEDFQVTLNKEWIGLFPQFAKLLVRSKKCKGDSDGRKKLHARREFTYIYFMLDPRSPLFEWPEDDKHKNALQYAELTNDDIKDGAVQEAFAVYSALADKASRAMRTYRSGLKSMDSLDKYLEKLDFTATDKKGELLHDPHKFTTLIGSLSKAYIALDEFKAKVYADITNTVNARGKVPLGYDEQRGNNNQEWNEGGAPEKKEAPTVQPDLDGDTLQAIPGKQKKFSFTDMSKITKAIVAPKIKEEKGEDDGGLDIPTGDDSGEKDAEEEL
jgi:hypothetical protein